MATTSEYRIFLGAAARRPALIGAVAPSSRGLAAQLAAIVPSSGRPFVVELGPGTGSVSAAIRRRLPEHGRQLAVELDDRMVAFLRQRHPWLTVLPGDAADLPGLVGDAAVHRVDAVISGLPWSVFEHGHQQRILDGVGQLLGPGGAFTTFAYLHALPLAGARRFRAELTRRFDEVVQTRAVWRNLPPALVYVCRRPRSAR